MKTNLCSQVLSSSRSTDWSGAGISTPPGNGVAEVNLLDFGADPTGQISSNAAFLSAQASLGGPGIITIPPGIYRFEQSLTLQDSQVVQGAGAQATELFFDLGGSGDLIRMVGTISGSADSLPISAEVGDSFVVVSDASQYMQGNVIKLYKDDLDLVNDSWAQNTVAQILNIVGKSGDSLWIDQKLRTDFPVSRNSAIKKLSPKSWIGIECLKITRSDATAGQTHNINIKYATDCWVKGIESSYCNFGHITIEGSTHIEVSGCYLHHAFNYGSGGKAYGFVLQGSSNLCLLENNVLEHLRHSILLQSGANGNVIAFNYSLDPFWDNFPAPSNSAGDIVCHGNYPFLNLFEHNIVQNLIIDNSHGANGPFNTFLRNRAELYGIIMTASNSPSQNFIGNEITNTLLGNYNLVGADHFEYGNNHRGTITPVGTEDLTDTSYFYGILPGYLDESWAVIGPPEMLNSGSIPARDRFLAGGSLTVCPQPLEWVVWTNGANTTEWHNPLNWHNLAVPIATDNVLVPATPMGGSLFPLLTVNATINQIYIAKGGRIETTEGVELTVLSE